MQGILALLAYLQITILQFRPCLAMLLQQQIRAIRRTTTKQYRLLQILQKCKLHLQPKTATKNYAAKMDVIIKLVGGIHIAVSIDAWRMAVHHDVDYLPQVTALCTNAATLAAQMGAIKIALIVTSMRVLLKGVVSKKEAGQVTAARTNALIPDVKN